MLPYFLREFPAATLNNTHRPRQPPNGAGGSSGRHESRPPPGQRV